MAITLTNGDVSHAPIEVSFPMPRAPHTNIQLQLTNNGPNLLLFLTTTTADAASSSPLGSFVYAMPNVSYFMLSSIHAFATMPEGHKKRWLKSTTQRASPTETLSTPLFTHSATLDFTTRLSKILARRTSKPVYVGNSISFASAGMGGTVEEEMEGFRRVVEVVMGLLEKEKAEASQ
jgi:hypothetical protein